jgi:hypothetical protein
MMSVFHLRHVDLHGVAEKARWPLAQALARLAAASRIIHRAIVTAKLRRLRSELMRHGGDVYRQPSDQDAEKFPQLPMMLGDKWDF